MLQDKQYIKKKAAFVLSISVCLPIMLAFQRVYYIGTETQPHLFSYVVCFVLSILLLILLLVLPCSFVVQIFSIKPLRILVGVGSRIEAFVLKRFSYFLLFAIFAPMVVIICTAFPASYTIFYIVRQLIIIPYMGLSLFLRGLDENDTFILKPIPEYESAYKRTKDPELDRRKPNHIEQASKNQYRAFLAKWFSGLSVFVQACAICYCSLVREEHNRILQMYEDFANRTNPTNDTDNNLKEKITTLKERADIISLMIL